MSADRIVIGIDADTARISYAVCDRERVRALHTIDRRVGRHAEQRTAYYADLRALMLHAADVGAVIYLEDIFLGENVAGYRQLAEVQGEIKHEAGRARVPVVNVGADAWRKAIHGVTRPRKTCKDMALTRAAELCGRTVTSDHEAEAACIALHGWRDQQSDKGKQKERVNNGS